MNENKNKIKNDENIIEKILEEWIAFYSSARKVGHSTTAIEGARATNAMVVCGSIRQVRQLPEVVPGIVYDQTALGGGLRGRRESVVWDNYALACLFTRAFYRIVDLKREVKLLEEKERRILKIIME